MTESSTAEPTPQVSYATWSDPGRTWSDPSALWSGTVADPVETSRLLVSWNGEWVEVSGAPPPTGPVTLIWDSGIWDQDLWG